MISFSRPAHFALEVEYLAEAASDRSPWGGGQFYSRARQAVGTTHPSDAVLLTQSCTAALELAAIALDIQPGDEVIVPSYTFVSTANAFALRGAKIVFVDSRPTDLNIDSELIEAEITTKTKAIVVVHYGGASCDMASVMEMARRYGIPVVEDAAQAIGASAQGIALGTIGDLGCLSFHGTKNVSSGEGGALLINTDIPGLRERALIAHEKGTDRASFLRGEVDKYTWRGLGSSFVPSEFTCAVLLAQLENLDKIQQRRLMSYADYEAELTPLAELGYRVLEHDIDGGNLHMFALIAPGEIQRDSLRVRLRERGVMATSHYEPLHESPFIVDKAGAQNHLPVASELSRRVLRLPMWSEAGLDAAGVSHEILDILELR